MNGFFDAVASVRRWWMGTNRPYSCVDECGYSVWKNGERKQLQCFRGCAVTEKVFAESEMCVSLKAATGLMAADGDESDVVAFVFV